MRIKRAPVVWTTYTLLVVAVIALALMQGCATQGYENVDTTRKAIVVANAEVRAANLLLQDLIGRRAISRDQANVALGHLQSAKDTLQSALDTVDVAGDPFTAGNRLQSARVALTAALTLLAPLVEE
jgi:type IV pilus biogenesis protein CpaD/CtpE